MKLATRDWPLLSEMRENGLLERAVYFTAAAIAMFSSAKDTHVGVRCWHHPASSEIILHESVGKRRVSVRVYSHSLRSRLKFALYTTCDVVLCVLSFVACLHVYVCSLFRVRGARLVGDMFVPKLRLGCSRFFAASCVTFLVDSPPPTTGRRLARGLR